MSKPHSPACDRNREPILAVLREHFAACRRVLEVGGGTGQHAVFFAKALPHLIWQTSDVPEHLDGIRLWLAEERLPNTPSPLELDVRGEWPTEQYDALFTANTLHIMSWEEVSRCFERMPSVLTPHAVVAVYGPFNYGGGYTSESNAAFDRSLRSRGAHMAIRDVEAVQALATQIGLELVADVAMPANNRTLIWRRRAREEECQ